MLYISTILLGKGLCQLCKAWEKGEENKKWVSDLQTQVPEAEERTAEKGKTTR